MNRIGIIVALLLAIAWAVPAQAQPIAGDALFTTRTASQYKAFFQTLPLWRIGIFEVEGGVGVSAWRDQDCFRLGWYVNCNWGWVSNPALLARVKATPFQTSRVEVYGTSSIVASIHHGNRILPSFHRLDLFTSLGAEYRVFPRLSLHATLGIPIGWDSIPTVINFGVTVQL